MNTEIKIASWFERLMDSRPFTAFGLLIITITVVVCVILIGAMLIFPDNGAQKQIDFVNACTASGKNAVIHYEEVQHGKTRSWEPVVVCMVRG